MKDPNRRSKQSLSRLMLMSIPINLMTWHGLLKFLVDRNRTGLGSYMAQDKVENYKMGLLSAAAPDSFTFVFLLKAAANYWSLMTGRQLHCQALLHGLDGHLFVGTTLISSRVEFSMKVFDEMLEPNFVAWDAAVTACFRGGDLESSERLFESMPFKDSTSSNLMLAGYAKAGEMEMARKVFSEMEVKDDVPWSSMVTALTQNGCFDEVFGVFMDLRQLGMRPNEVSLTGVRFACAQAGALEFGRIVHGIHGNVELAEQVKERLSELCLTDSGDYVLLSNVYAVAGKWNNVETVRRSMTNQRVKKTPGCIVSLQVKNKIT
ncbi:hypothetical protein LWI29_015907 [Acer saccharum]|uniref:Pentatricopeptide repeat-containing protein n=1 Tax=Acer saccharum TaxID=4024 RepID=A0AA39SNM1_ACESA|nr:hypothetical protein LWI29_015907 [Acer saccharum]